MKRRWAWCAMLIVAGGLAGAAAGRVAEDLRRPLASPLKILLKAIADCGLRIERGRRAGDVTHGDH